MLCGQWRVRSSVGGSFRVAWGCSGRTGRGNCLRELQKVDDGGRRGPVEGVAESGRGNGRRKFNERDIRITIARFKGDGGVGAVGFKEPEAGEIRDMEKRS